MNRASSLMIEARVGETRARREELEKLLADPAILADPQAAQRLSREYRKTSALVALSEELRLTEKSIAETKEILDLAQEPELAEMARAELPELERRRTRLERELLDELAPRDPDSDKNCILEIRAAAGGEESALFAGTLFRMYTHYIEKLGWKLEVLSSRPSELDGYKEIIFEVQSPKSKVPDGTSAPYGLLRFESGVHRVQRVPRTEASGRIHTSTVTVAVLPEVEETEIELDPGELRIEVFRAGGHGGQLVNKIESAVRITHVPTGIQASCQDDRSQTRNKAKAMKILLARIQDAREAAESAKLVDRRRTMIGTGERSEKIRTYNFPQNRVTDHRIGVTVYNLPEILNGDIGGLHQSLRDAELGKWLGNGTTTPGRNAE